MDRSASWLDQQADLGLGGKRAFRPTIMGQHGIVSSGHSLSTRAGVHVLEAGGNAVDAGVAAALAGCVLQSNFADFGGVAAIHLYDKASDRSATLAGVGPWPALADLGVFRTECAGHIPSDIRNALVPGAPDAYLTALEQFGTWSFSKTAAAAIDLATYGFPMYPFRYQQQLEIADWIGRHPTIRSVMWPDARQPEVGEVFRQPDLGRTLNLLRDAETASVSGGRSAGFDAARGAFYRGEPAARIDRFSRDNGGFLRLADMAEYRVEVGPSIKGVWRGYDIHTCPFWSKGPLLIQVLNILEHDDLAALGHNSPSYIHLLTEALKLGFADRHQYFGDPSMIDVPADGLLSKEYARARRRFIQSDRAWSAMPPAGDPRTGSAVSQLMSSVVVDAADGAHSSTDTSALCVVDNGGNVFAATFSDSFVNGPIIPGAGIVASTRGVQAWADPRHPNRVQPGQRPVVTPNPAMVFEAGQPRMVLGSPGSDVQLQAMLQVLLNVLVFGMDVQTAIEAPRFATYSHPDSFEPHFCQPGVLKVEARLPETTLSALSELGHRVQTWRHWQWQAGGVCAIETHGGVLFGGADPRRENYAAGW